MSHDRSKPTRRRIAMTRMEKSMAGGGDPKNRRKRIPPRSDKVIALLGERARVVDAAFDRDHGRCQAETRVPHVRCGGPLDPHEIIPRSVWVAGQYAIDNVVMVCRAHHRWIDNHPHDAHAVGLHGFSHERKE